MIEESVQPSSPHCLPPDRHARFFACWFSNLISQENIKAVFSCCAMSAMSRDVDMMLYLALNRHFIVRELGARIFLRMKKVVAEWKMTREVVSSTLLTYRWHFSHCSNDSGGEVRSWTHVPKVRANTVVVSRANTVDVSGANTIDVSWQHVRASVTCPFPQPQAVAGSKKNVAGGSERLELVILVQPHTPSFTYTPTLPLSVPVNSLSQDRGHQEALELILEYWEVE